jgi:hypothetical protein
MTTISITLLTEILLLTIAAAQNRYFSSSGSAKIVVLPTLTESKGNFCFMMLYNHKTKFRG